jgi:hypothetical protein
LGTSLSISSDERTTIGSISTASARAAANPEKPRWSPSTQNAKMNSPATIDGIPVITSTRNRTADRSRPRPYSTM